jgi:Protein of unknown function (DUF2798)
MAGCLHVASDRNSRCVMLPIPRHFAHYVFGVIQSGITTFVASGIGSATALRGGTFLSSWMTAWIASWALLVPVVLLVAPLIRRASIALTRAPDGDDGSGA